MFQKMHCVEDDAHVYAMGEVFRARKTEAGPVWVSKDDVLKARVGTMEKNAISVTVHPADEVMSQVRFSTNGYRVRPPKNATRSQRLLIAALTELAADPATVMVGEMSPNSRELGCGERCTVSAHDPAKRTRRSCDAPMSKGG